MPSPCHRATSAGAPQLQLPCRPLHLLAALASVFLLLLAPTAFCDTDPLDCDNDDNDGLPPSSGSPVCSASDRQALFQFKASISSDPNRALSNWISSNCCLWNGVTCDSSGRVIRLKLPEQHLKGTISPHLGTLSALRVLTLYDNNLSGPLPPSLGNLLSLQRLCIFGNPSISGVIPASFGQLKSLQVLELSYNALSGKLPTNIGGMSSLQQISVAGNKISGIIPASFGSLSNLYTAGLSHNQFSGRIPDGFASGLSSLIFLFLNNNQITGLPADLSNLTRLQWIDLSNNPIGSSNAISGLATAPMLVQIELESCQLSGPFPSWVSGLTQHDNDPISDEVTPALVLSDNAISGPIPSTLGDLTFLEVLGLDRNKLTGTIPASFSKLQSLRNFNVSYNQLSGRIPQVAPFTTFPVSAYKPGNPGLCGAPLPASDPCKK